MAKICELLNKAGRTFWITLTGFLKDGYRDDSVDDYRRVSRSKALLVGSLCKDGLHAPVLDIDFSAELIPSTTPGHFHLYLDKKMTWEKYSQLLEALYEAGIIQRGFYDMSLDRKQSMVLLPGKDRNKVTIGPRAIS